MRSLARAGTRCDLCNQVGQWTLPFEGADTCACCVASTLAARELLNLGPAIRWLRENAACAYCGMPASDVEHVVPRNMEVPTFTVPSCGECNNMAGGRHFLCFADKREFIRHQIRRKYKSVLRTGDWDSDELAEMSPTMRHMIRTHLDARHVVEARLMWRIESLEC